MRRIGAAHEYWRLRVTRLDTEAELDLEWREDLLYREPPVDVVTAIAVWSVEAVPLNAEERLRTLATFSSRVEADDYAASVAEDLGEMTKSQFENAYFPPQATTG